MGKTNFDEIDVSEGYNVNGTKIIDSSGEMANSALSAPVLRSMQFTVSFDDMVDSTTTGTYTHTESIPVGAVVTQTLLNDVVGFAGDTSATITIGDDTDADRYNTGTPNVFVTADSISAGAVSGTAWHTAAKAPVVTVTTASDFTSVTAGSVKVTIFYYIAV